jgi:hypothetical protein
LKPAAVSAEMSARSNSDTFDPSLVRRSSETVGKSTRE